MRLAAYSVILTAGATFAYTIGQHVVAMYQHLAAVLP